MSDKTYHGWSNYETWVEEQAEQAFANASVPTQIFTREERATLALEKVLRDEHEEALPELQGFAADLLNAAMSEVDWYEIAKSLIDNVEKDAEVEA